MRLSARSRVVSVVSHDHTATPPPPPPPPPQNVVVGLRMRLAHFPAVLVLRRRGDECCCAAMQQATSVLQRTVRERRPYPGEGRRRRRARRCGICQGCIREDCGQCRNCKDKVKFGGPGTKKQRCMLRACTNMVSMFHFSKYVSVML